MQEFCCNKLLIRARIISAVPAVSGVYVGLGRGVLQRALIRWCMCVCGWGGGKGSFRHGDGGAAAAAAAAADPSVSRGCRSGVGVVVVIIIVAVTVGGMVNCLFIWKGEV